MRRRLTAAILAAAALLCGAVNGCSPRQKAYEQTAFVMDTVFTATFESSEPAQTFADMLERLTVFEQTYSLYDEHSQTHKLNDAAGDGAIVLDAAYIGRLAQIQQLCRESGGRFDVTIAPLATLWNVGGGGPRPPPDKIEAARALVGIAGLTVDAEASTASLARAGMGVDLGGIAKGIALDELRSLCADKAIERGVFSLGGSVYVHSDKGGGAPYIVGVRDPDTASGALLGTLALTNAFVTTSGAYERFFIEDGVRYHHILDPATGYPADSDIESVTVVGDSGLMGDYLSTLLFVMGTREALPYVRERGIDAIIVAGGTLYVSEGLRDRFTPGGGYTVETI